MKPTEIAWSHSSLKGYVSCPHKYYREKVVKDVPFAESEALRRGNDLHDVMEKAVKIGMPLPKRWDQPHLQDTVAWARSLPGVRCEEQLAFTSSLERCEWFDRKKRVWSRCKIDLQAFFSEDTALVLDYKGLALDTLLPTPTGFTTMGDIAVGDQVFDMDGKICTVNGKSEVKLLPCYEVEFASGAIVVCDEEHLWHLSNGQVQPVTKLYEGHHCMSVPAPAALQPPAKHLPVPPFTLGLWLSDGREARSEIAKPYDEVWAAVERDGYSVTVGALRDDDGKCRGRTPKGLTAQLRYANLLGNKHIPEAYFTASYAQRLDLVRGLMNGDGSVNVTRGELVFTNCDRRLSEDVARLLRTMGVQARVHTTQQSGFGLTVTAYPVSCRLLQEDVMLIAHKAEAEQRARAKHYPKQQLTNPIIRIEEISPVPTQCIAVNSPSRTYLCTEQYIVTHNTGKYWGDDGQAGLTALAMFWANPELQSVTTCWYYVDQNQKVPGKFERSDVPELMEAPLKTLADISRSYKTERWPKTPGISCKFCDVKDCEFRGKGQR